MSMANKITISGSKIGWVGTGVMGQSMVKNLLNAGYSVVISNRTKTKAVDLITMGAKWFDTPKEVATQADIIFTMVGFPQDVEEVYFSEKGIFNGISKGKIIVDMTTTSPSLSEKLYKKAKSLKAHAVDAPVSGGDIGAKNGTLSIMAGGDMPIVDSLYPLLECLGKNIVYQGKCGAGQHAKMCNQVVIASTMIGVCEALLYGQRAGLDLPTLLSSINKGAAGCWSLDHLAPRIMDRNFDPGFYVNHFIKDMGIALQEAERMNITLPGLKLAHQLYLAVQEQGHGKKGTHALMLALEKISR